MIRFIVRRIERLLMLWTSKTTKCDKHFIKISLSKYLLPSTVYKYINKKKDTNYFKNKIKN